MSSSINSTLLHVQTAAYAYLEQAPALSSYLYSRFIDLADSRNVVLPDALSRSACAACHTIWIPGCNVSVALERRGTAFPEKASGENDASHKASKANMSFRQKVIIYRCGMCSNSTEFRIPNDPTLLPKKLRISKEKSSKSAVKYRNSFDVERADSNKASTSGSGSAETMSGSSSKKRQKLRKQNTLQSIVASAKAKAKSEKESGLSLMDIMKLA